MLHILYNITCTYIHNIISDDLIERLQSFDSSLYTTPLFMENTLNFDLYLKTNLSDKSQRAVHRYIVHMYLECRKGLNIRRRVKIDCTRIAIFTTVSITIYKTWNRCIPWIPWCFCPVFIISYVCTSLNEWLRGRCQKMELIFFKQPKTNGKDEP